MGRVLAATMGRFVTTDPYLISFDKWLKSLDAVDIVVVGFSIVVGAALCGVALAKLFPLPEPEKPVKKRDGDDTDEPNRESDEWMLRPADFQPIDDDSQVDLNSANDSVDFLTEKYFALKKKIDEQAREKQRLEEEVQKQKGINVFSANITPAEEKEMQQKQMAEIMRLVSETEGEDAAGAVHEQAKLYTDTSGKMGGTKIGAVVG